MEADKGRPGALYKQVAADLRDRIRSGEFPVDMQLPSKTQLIERYGVALGTVNAALRELRQAGMIETLQGRGSYVISAEGDASDDEVRKLGTGLTDALERLAKVEERLSALEQGRQ